MFTSVKVATLHHGENAPITTESMSMSTSRVLTWCELVHERAVFTPKDAAQPSEGTWSHYIKLVTGPTLAASTMTGRFDELGDSAADLCALVELELWNLADDDTKLWLRLCKVGKSAIVSTCRVPTEDYLDDDQVELVKGSPTYASDKLANVLETLALSADARASESHEKLLELVGQVIRSERAAAFAEADAVIAAEQGHSTLDTLREVSPLLIPLINRATGGKGKSKAAPAPGAPTTQAEAIAQLTPEKAEEAADSLVTALVGLCGAHPKVITPARLAQLAPILGLG